MMTIRVWKRALSIGNSSTNDALPSACPPVAGDERGLGLLTDAELDQVTAAGSKPGAGDDEGPYPIKPK
jgi:hypothetical protein